ncbi:MAG: hypothetical protein QOJ38_887 [Solirubrobacterales bacterium]|jgi:hypothetical protein|nr:hypothetical protein [Solirubrobacterales bacterium]
MSAGPGERAAELIADGGAASASEEFFRSPSFLAAEGVTHTLRVGEELALPVVVREIPGGDGRDASSPYGYPGGSSTPAIDPAAVDWSQTGLVSVFVRDRIGEGVCFTGGTMRTHVQIADPALPRKSRMSDRQQVRRNLRDGWRVETIPGPDVDASQRAAFERAYRQTMERTEAAARYFFDSDYFAAAIGAERAWLLLALAPEGEIVAGSIAALSDGYLHYYLSGTADSHLTASPMKNLIEAKIELAAELEVSLSLGGGARPGDSLEAFKRGFANREEPFHTHEIVCDAAKYQELSEELSRSAPESDFFPRYRAAAATG